jgi:hypothetical protein
VNLSNPQLKGKNMDGTTHNFDCYRNALPDEPTFTLLGRDPQAPGLIYLWASEREARITEGSAPRSDMAKVMQARELAARMQAWRTLNDGAWRAANPELPLPVIPLEPVDPDLAEATALAEFDARAAQLRADYVRRRAEYKAARTAQPHSAEVPSAGPRLFSPDFHLGEPVTPGAHLFTARNQGE